MPPADIKPRHVFALLVVFWAAWLYTEISEYIERQDQWESVNQFMNKGDRFSREDGDALEARIEALEETVEHINEDD